MRIGSLLTLRINAVRRLASSFGPSLSLGTCSREQGEQSQSWGLSRISSTQALGGLHPPQPEPQPPLLPGPGLGLLLREVSETKVWLCRVLQALPKITLGNAQMEEGVFPESYKF